MSSAVDELRWAAIPHRVLNIGASLASGQCFRWQRANGEWRGVIQDTIVRIVPNDDGFHWQTYPEPDQWRHIADYFALDVALEPLFEQWIAGEPRIAETVERHSGLRILRQEPGEVFFSFICASNNTIQKIRRSVGQLAARCGRALGDLDGQAYYAFPNAGSIATLPDDVLRADLWGFRSSRLLHLARKVAESSEWLDGLSELPYREAHAELSGQFGIGPKIADCICLFGLGHDQAVPVDTHVRQIAASLFPAVEGANTLTQRVYDTIAGQYRARFGPYAGWAQQYLFFDRLNSNTIDNRAAATGSR
jgi:N-glycosylase/DNA lyase